MDLPKGANSMKKSEPNQPKPTRQQAVDRLLTQLPGMDRKSLEKLWHNLFAQRPGRALRRETLIPILAYRIQEKAFGGIKESTARKLRQLSEDATGAKHLQASLRPKVGTRYIREYRGKMHEVSVLESGYEYEDKIYRSLTEVAKVITGSKRSGPVFFELNTRVRMTIA
jgi:hypothetical protein